MASTGEAVWRLGRRPALDGLRGVAVLMVVVAHAHIPGMQTAGGVGVTVFFVLSGFLITSQLAEEHDRTGVIRLGDFYRRRVRRLFPALFACIAVVGALSLVIPGLVPPGGVLAASVHVSNWYQITAPGHAIGALSHTWSLGVEEQFYLTWPLLLAVLIRSRRLTLAVVGLGIVASTAARFALWDHGAGGYRVYFGADTHADALLAGCALALVVARTGAPRPRSWLVLAALAALAGLGLTTGATSLLTVPSVVAALTVAAIVFSLDGCPPIEGSFLRLVGRRSYGIYLWHFPVSVLVTMHYGRLWAPQVAIMLPVAALLTVLSWRYVEEPFQRRRVRVRSVDGLRVPRSHESCAAA